MYLVKWWTSKFETSRHHGPKSKVSQTSKLHQDIGNNVFHHYIVSNFNLDAYILLYRFRHICCISFTHITSWNAQYIRTSPFISHSSMHAYLTAASGPYTNSNTVSKVKSNALVAGCHEDNCLMAAFNFHAKVRPTVKLWIANFLTRTIPKINPFTMWRQLENFSPTPMEYGIPLLVVCYCGNIVKIIFVTIIKSANLTTSGVG